MINVKEYLDSLEFQGIVKSLTQAPQAIPAPQAPVKPVAPAKTADRWTRFSKACTKAARLLSRNARKLNKHLLAFLVGVATLGLIAVAGYVSFDHIHDVALFARQSSGVAIATPFTIDGMILISGYRLRQPGITRTQRIIALTGMVVGILASLAGNLIHALILMPHGPQTFQDYLTLALSMWPVIPMIIALEQLVHVRKMPAVIRKTTPPAKKAPARSK